MFLNPSRENRTLLNPAFCGQILLNTVKEYENRTSKGLPFSLAFLVLPLILHKETFEKIRYSTTGQFFTWLDTQTIQTIEFSSRAEFLKPTTLEAISILSYYNLVKIETEITTVDFDHSLNAKNYSGYMKKYQEKAIQIGRWFAETNSISTIYLMLGIKP